MTNNETTTEPMLTDELTVIFDRGARHIGAASGLTACGLKINVATSYFFEATPGQRISCAACANVAR